METRYSKRNKLWFSETNHDYVDNIDRISDLPDHILHHILFILPIKSIAQTSVLSKRWGSLWSSFPDLDFTTINPTTFVTTTSTTNTKTKRSSSSTAFPMDFLTKVLALRDKHSDLRTLRFRAPLSFSRWNGLIRFAIRHNVQELDVEVATVDYFNFPRGVIASESLKIFRLKSRHPGFRLLPSSVMAGGFRSLHTLSLSLVMLYEQSSLLDLFTESSFPRLKQLNLDSCYGMKKLKVSCLALKDLTLENCFQLHGLDVCCEKLERLKVARCFDAYCNDSYVKINAPCLKYFSWEYNAITCSTWLENLKSLHEASVDFFPQQKDLSLEKLQSVCSLLSGLASAPCLRLENQCIEILSTTNYCAQLLHPFNNLKILELHTDFNKNIVPGLAFLFRNSPLLHTLILKIINDYKAERRQWNRDLWDIYTSEEEQYWELQIQSLRPFLNHLKVVKIEGFLECENEVSLARFLLKHGKHLQEMTLCTSHFDVGDSLRRQKIRWQMMGFSWASSNAKIEYH